MFTLLKENVTISRENTTKITNNYLELSGLKKDKNEIKTIQSSKYLIQVSKNKGKAWLLKMYNEMEEVRPNILVKEIREKRLCHLLKKQIFSSLILKKPLRMKLSYSLLKRDKLQTE